ncbi:MAG TPA: acyl-CoA dehydrogenase [Usitatibacteraceae bacterium]|nr:acyl-CoA dehydrogenase [Usitatibacteraceae bacterium]
MSNYTAPLKDINFLLNDVIGLERVAALPGCEEVSRELVEQILAEAGKFSAEVVAPINRSGDTEGAKWKDGAVTTAKGFREVYQQYVEGGWSGLAGPVEFGGQGLPHLVAIPVSEMLGSASMAFKLCPLLTNGAVDALMTHAGQEVKEKFLPKMVAGEWTGTMNLTEPQAGSDLALVRSKATPQADGTYKITGQKIFITYGEHDFTENIIHLVLARIDGAPEGVKGISLFVVPKFNVNADGSLGARNDVQCVSIEHKLGIHGSPTCVMAYGDNGGATGYLVGEANRGLEYMFVMMNAARLGVGLEGVSISERAYQHACVWARERLQGRPVVPMPGNPKTVAIVHHPDIKRMLLTMRAYTEAARALIYWTAGCLDVAERSTDDQDKRSNQSLVDLMIPIVKGWSTEAGIEVASLGVQVHGGMGYVEETGAAQYYRDSRISTIYEGTTGIQANDLVGRKVGREGGQTMLALIAEMDKTTAALKSADDAVLRGIGASLAASISELKRATEWIVTMWGNSQGAVMAGAVPYLKLAGTVTGGWMMARAATVAARQLAAGGDSEFLKAKLMTTRFYAAHILPLAGSFADVVTGGADSVLAMEEAYF